MKRNELDSAYGIVRQFFGNHKTISNGLRTENGKIIYEREALEKMWKQYIEELYDGQKTISTSRVIENKCEVNQEEEGDSILRGDFDKALTKLKNNKASGIDDIPAKLLKMAGDGIPNSLYQLVSEIYETGDIHSHYQKCIMIPIPKKNQPTDVNNTAH